MMTTSQSFLERRVERPGRRVARDHRPRRHAGRGDAGSAAADRGGDRPPGARRMSADTIALLCAGALWLGATLMLRARR